MNLQKQNKNSSFGRARIFGMIGVVIAIGVIVACTGGNAKAKINFVFKDAPSAGVVAKINGENITEEQLIGDAQLEILQLKKQEYDLKMNQLNKMLIERLVGGEAKKAGISTEEFLSKNVVKGDIKISDADFKKFVKEKNIPESNINDQVKERIYAYMKDQKREEMVQTYIAKLTKSTPIEVYFKKPKSNIKVDVGTSPFAGGENAKVTIVEFSDFQCPFCSKAAVTVDQLKKKYGNKIKLVFKHFPLPMHPEARPASEMAMCLNEQGKDKFWKFHDLAFKNYQNLKTEDIMKYAKEAGGNEAKFKECFESKRFAEAVSSDLAYGEKLGVRSTPTFFVNGQLLSGALPLEQFSEVIDEEMESL